VTYLAISYDSYSRASARQVCQAVLAAVVCWVVLFAAKLLLGYLLKQASASYVRHYESRRAGLKAGGGRRVTLVGAVPHAASGGVKKED
jgi:hypothetical protein